MIDFDLAGKEKSMYPSNYNHYHIQERHSTARANRQRKKVHGTFALSVILKSSFPCIPNIDRLVHLLRQQTVPKIEDITDLLPSS